jgi:hypothetical protein
MLLRLACMGKLYGRNSLHNSVDGFVDNLGTRVYKLCFCAGKMQNGPRFL